VALWLRRRLEDDWRRGALAGDAVEQAFTVRVDDVTTSADDRAAGRLIGLIEVAPVAPLEFILLRLGVSRDEVRISEV
jgi:phage tail sheath protein FI